MTIVQIALLFFLFHRALRIQGEPVFDPGDEDLPLGTPAFHPGDEDLPLGTPAFHPGDEDLSLGTPVFSRARSRCSSR